MHLMSPSASSTRDLLKAAGLPAHRAPTHPGHVLLHEFIEPRGLARGTVAHDLGIQVARLNAIINGKRRVTEEMALLLGRYLSCPAATWLTLQHACDLAVAIQALPPQRLQSIHPLADPH